MGVTQVPGKRERRSVLDNADVERAAVHPTVIAELAS